MHYHLLRQRFARTPDMKEPFFFNQSSEKVGIVVSGEPQEAAEEPLGSL
jgi:hypothetical protein